MSIASGPIFVRPEDTQRVRISDLSERVITATVQYGVQDVVGLGSATSLVCSAVNVSRNIANVFVTKTSIELIDFGILGKFDSIFFTVENKAGPDWEEEMKKLDASMNLEKGPDSQQVAVGREDTPERMSTLCLLKLSRFKRVKVVAAGFAITNAISTALRVAKGGIAKEPVGIILVGLGSIESRQQLGPTRPVTAINIYLETGKQAEYDKRHREIMRLIISRLPPR